MAKRKTRSADPQAIAPNKLTMTLFAPGMSPMHRAGLGGLAATLKYIERAYASGQLKPEELPGGPWPNNEPPWSVEPLAITLDFGEPTNARSYLERLFRIAFGLKDDLIDLPGQYDNTEPPLPVRALLQQAITLTFLQHGKARKLGEEKVCSYQPGSPPEATIELNYRPCISYKHQTGWRDMVTNDGCLTVGPIEVAGPLNPGAIVRHVAFTTDTKIEEDAAHILPLYFALVGCVAVVINRGCAVLLVPEVTDLVRFAQIRPWLTPSTERECQITSAGDAALQAQIRLWAKGQLAVTELPGFHASIFQPTPWASQQKSRVRTMIVPPGDERTLERFEVALAELPPRLKSRSVKTGEGRGRKKPGVQKTEWFWVDSVLRPLVADNLAQGRPWYAGFTRLFTATDPTSNRPLHDRLLFEKEGMHAMIKKVPWEDRGESTVVRAVHEALRRRYGRIAKENKGRAGAMKNRWQAEYDRWRLVFAGAKTADQFRRAFCDLLSRAGVNPVLQEEWPDLLPMLAPSRWQLTRDLALLALASYKREGAQELDQSDQSEVDNSTPTVQ